MAISSVTWMEPQVDQLYVSENQLLGGAGEEQQGRTAAVCLPCFCDFPEASGWPLGVRQDAGQDGSSLA